MGEAAQAVTDAVAASSGCEAAAVRGPDERTGLRRMRGGTFDSLQLTGE